MLMDIGMVKQRMQRYTISLFVSLVPVAFSAALNNVYALVLSCTIFLWLALEQQYWRKVLREKEEKVSVNIKDLLGNQ